MVIKIWRMYRQSEPKWIETNTLREVINTAKMTDGMEEKEI
jgi:hypothetical protein